MHRFVSILLALLLAAGAAAQTDLPQVFSPNAAELGKYGKIPVSYFNGLPNISIPLTELKAKNYSLPVYLTYHAGGNKPDQHPGWVGLGWTLHAGGCINRIVNGNRDEMGRDEFLSLEHGVWGSGISGYYAHARDFQQMNIDSLFMSNYANTGIYLDYDPDEFQVNMEGLSSSFYLVGENEGAIKSKDPVSYRVQIDTAATREITVYENHSGNPSIRATQYTWIKTIHLTDASGIEYVFGDDDNAIDFNYSVGRSGHNLTCTADTWHLSKIKLPNGESIHFEYIKSGKPVYVTDRHFRETAALNGAYFPYDYDTHTDYGNYSFTIQQPSYLHRIHATASGDELLFHISPSVELPMEMNSDALYGRLLNRVEHLTESLVLEDNQYNRLDSIVSNHGTFRFSYTSDITSRLKLTAISTGDGQDVIGRYSFTYNPLHLPPYNSKHTDKWGYYSQTTQLDDTGYYYLSDETGMQAEILRKIEYPTGGKTILNYEGHRYGHIAEQYPFVLTTGSGLAGGLRIHTLTDSLETGLETRTFLYESEDGSSSGILGGMPIFTTSGKTFDQYPAKSGWDGISPFHFPAFTTENPYGIFSEMPLNQLSRTDGSHITYSRVTECHSDGSETVYYYTNHEDYPDRPYVYISTNYDNTDLSNPFCSKSLSRGLLYKKEYRSGDAGHTLVQMEEQWFAQDTTDYVNAIEHVIHCGVYLNRFSNIHVYTYFPGLLEKRVTAFSNLGSAPHVETTRYAYDANRQLVQTQGLWVEIQMTSGSHTAEAWTV